MGYTILILTLICTCFSSVVGWGKDGHAVIATIAQSMLSPAAEQGVNLLLNGESMASVSSWADEITHEDEWRWTTPLHFTNVRDTECYKGKGEGYSNCTFDFARDCVDLDGANPGFCNAGAVANFTRQLAAGVSAGLSGNTTRDALKFVIHFVGDIHQPLHCGMLADRGGVEINIFYDVNEQGSHWNLHQVWDFGLLVNKEGVEGHTDALIREIQGHLGSTWHSEIEAWRGMMDPKDWVQESLNQATTFGYRFPNGTEIRRTHDRSDEVHIGKALDVYAASGAVIELQLARAAVRLAELLNGIFGQTNPQPTSWPTSFQIPFVSNVSNTTTVAPPAESLIKGFMSYSWPLQMQVVNHGAGAIECVHFYNSSGPCDLYFSAKGMYRVLAEPSPGQQKCCLDTSTSAGIVPPSWASRLNASYIGRQLDPVYGFSGDLFSWPQLRSPKGVHEYLQQAGTGRPVTFTFPAHGGRQDYHFDADAMYTGTIPKSVFALPDKDTCEQQCVDYEP